MGPSRVRRRLLTIVCWREDWSSGMCGLFSSALGAPVEPSTKASPAANDPSLGAHLQVWLRADALALKDSAQVFRWPDSSGNNRDAAPTIGVYEGTGLPPTFVKSSSINGRPAVRFDLNTALATPGERPLAIEGNAAYTLFVIANLKPNPGPNGQDVPCSKELSRAKPEDSLILGARSP